MSRAVYFDAFSGISGDMTLGALLHAGMPFAHLQSELAKLGLSNSYQLEIRPVRQHEISGIKLDVTLTQTEDHRRSLSTITQLIQNSQLSDKVKTRAVAIFTRLAEAEAKIHGVARDEVHFHEVGAIDAIVDIVGACIGFDYFELEEFYCGPLPSGAGFVRSAHGLIPVPAPATLELLTNAGATFAPALTLPGGIEYPPRMEMVTPTGAAIVATLCRFERPALKLNCTGYGYGSKELPWPNALRLWIGDTPSTSSQPQPATHQALSTHTHEPQSEQHHDHSHDHPHLPASHSEPDHPETKPTLTNEPVHYYSAHQISSEEAQIPIESSVISYQSSVLNSPIVNRKSEIVNPSTPSQVSLLETNLDDMTPEGLGFLMEKLLAVGALDVYFTPIQMKKNRPATMLSVIVRPEDEARIAEIILRESSSFGLRVSQMQRYIAEREFAEVEISVGKVRVKRKILNGETVEVVPEYESVAALARQSNRPWREIYDEVKKVAHLAKFS